MADEEEVNMEHWDHYHFEGNLFKSPHLIEDTPDLYLVSVDHQSLVVKQFPSEMRAIDFQEHLADLSSHPNIPNPLTLGYRDPRLIIPAGVVFNVKYDPILSFFERRRDSYLVDNMGHQSFYKYIEDHFQQIFFGAMAGMRTLLKAGYIVLNFRSCTTVVEDGTDENGNLKYRAVFLDFAPKTEYLYAFEATDAVVWMIKDLRDVMRCVIGLSGIPYDDRANLLANQFVPDATISFLIRANNRYIEVIGAIDPDYVLFDAMVWDYRDISERHWNVFMMFEDYRHSPQLRIYYSRFPVEWKTMIEEQSFFDINLTTQYQKSYVKKAKEIFIRRVLQWESETKAGRLNTRTIRDIILDYDFDVECSYVGRGLSAYDDGPGIRWIIKIKRNGTQHYNEIAVALNMEMKTLKGIVESVEDEIHYSSSQFFWFFNEIWAEERVEDWIYHKDMIKGVKSWQVYVGPLLARREEVKGWNVDRDNERAQQVEDRLCLSQALVIGDLAEVHDRALEILRPINIDE